MRAVITGTSGFIGKRLLTYASDEKKWKVISLARKPTHSPNVKDIVMDDLASMDADALLIPCRPDVLIHLAAAGVNHSQRDIGILVASNVVLPFRIVELAARCKIGTVVIAGSCSEYTTQVGNGVFSEQCLLESFKLYGATKAAGGMLAMAAGVALGVRVAVVRIFKVYGYGEQLPRLFPSLISRLSLGERVPLTNGSQVRDFIYIDDVCEGLLRVALKMHNGLLQPEAYNLCTGVESTVRAFAEAIARMIGKDKSFLGFGDLPLRPDDIQRVVGDNTKLCGALGWTPQYNLEQGLRAALSKCYGTDHA